MHGARYHHEEHADAQPFTMTLEQLAWRSGEPVERLMEWQRMGLIGHGGAFLTEDVGRARLVHELLHYGHSIETISEAFEHEDSVLHYFLENMSRNLLQPMFSLPEAAEIVGMELADARRIAESTGISEGGEMLDQEDIECLRACKIAIDAGYPEDALLQILRVYADATRRAAEVGQRTSHFYMHQPIQHELPAGKVMDRLNETFSKIEPLVEPALLYFFRKGAMKAAWEDMLMHLEEEMGLVEKPETPGQVRRAIMFVDLASFTPLAEAMGDLKAVLVLERFAQLVRAAVSRCHGRIVKQIGDAFMIVFPECYSAVSCGLELEQRSSTEPQFPAIRVGLHYGPVLYREGDYIGSNVNIASRLAEDAHRHQMLITTEVRLRAKNLEGVEYIRLGKRRLKGLTTEVEVFEAKSAGPAEAAKFIDPVCGMELGPGEVAARLTLDAHDHAFCSDDCLKKFVRAPEKYTR